MAELNYKEFVAGQLVRSRDEPNGVIFKNSTPEHARIAMDAIIGNTRKDLKLMARALHRDVHDPYHLLKALKSSPELMVEVIVEVDDPFAIPESALSALSSEPSVRERISVRQLQQPTLVHLAVGDKVLARIEEDQAARRAIIVFNNKEIAGAAASRFSEIWPSCKELLWPPLRTAPS